MSVEMSSFNKLNELWSFRIPYSFMISNARIGKFSQEISGKMKNRKIDSFHMSKAKSISTFASLFLSLFHFDHLFDCRFLLSLLNESMLPPRVRTMIAALQTSTILTPTTATDRCCRIDLFVWHRQ